MTTLKRLAPLFALVCGACCAGGWVFAGVPTPPELPACMLLHCAFAFFSGAWVSQ